MAVYRLPMEMFTDILPRLSVEASCDRDGTKEWVESRRIDYAAGHKDARE